MNIGLLDIDGHNFPNLALMKLSAYHKSVGNTVTWYNTTDKFDILYKAKVFTFTDDYPDPITNADLIVEGGTGYDIHRPLIHDNIQPDYSLYPISKWYDNQTAYGFLTRGCIRQCSHCLVPVKEGNIRPYMDIEEIAQDRKHVILMDNNVLASDHGLMQIEKIIKLKLRVDFNQGLDARLITRDVAQLLARVKWLSPLRMACDNISMIDIVERTTNLLREYKCKPKRYMVYVMLTDLNNAHEILKWCKKLKVDPFAQPFRDFTKNQIIPKWQMDMARWANRRSIFKSCDFKDYQPRKNFKCEEYFSQINSSERA